jgi:hypothetical protein
MSALNMQFPSPLGRVPERVEGWGKVELGKGRINQPPIYFAKRLRPTQIVQMGYKTYVPRNPK